MAYELDVDSIFSYHAPSSPAVAELHDAVRYEMGVTARFIRDNVPASAEKTLAIRHLQMAMMFANSAVAQYSNKES